MPEGPILSAIDALGEELSLQEEDFQLVVIGGAALIALGLVDRSTRDVDVVALVRDDRLSTAEPLPRAVAAAADRVARTLGLPDDWLNTGPAGSLAELPEGFLDRALTRPFGPRLRVWFASRIDQIHFKLYAYTDDDAPGRHEQDLRALSPTADELRAAARWARALNAPEPFRSQQARALRALGVPDDDLGD